VDTPWAEEWFDTKVYDSYICRCLYNVLAVKEESDGELRRIGIWKIHIHAFDKEAQGNKLVEL
jgi:hypothetical protein